MHETPPSTIVPPRALVEAFQPELVATKPEDIAAVLSLPLPLPVSVPVPAVVTKEVQSATAPVLAVSKAEKAQPKNISPETVPNIVSVDNQISVGPALEDKTEIAPKQPWIAEITETEIAPPLVTEEISVGSKSPNKLELSAAEQLIPAEQAEVKTAIEITSDADIAAGAEAETEPAAVTIEQFTDTLFLLAARIDTRAEQALSSPTAEANVPVLHTIAERITNLPETEQAEVMPVLSEIHSLTANLQHLRLTNPEAITPELLAETEAKLTEACIALFESLHIAYDQDTLALIVQLFLTPVFAEQLESAIDYADEGTHERKCIFPLFGTLASLVDAHSRLFNTVLGNVATAQHCTISKGKPFVF